MSVERRGGPPIIWFFAGVFWFLWAVNTLNARLATIESSLRTKCECYEVKK